jgi:hypothetical protein
VVNQATQPAYSLVKEGRELAGVDSLSLRPYIAQLGGFRIESKLDFSHLEAKGIGYARHQLAQKR